MKYISIAAILFVFSISCKKEIDPNDGHPRYCYVITNQNLDSLKTVCNKTQYDMYQEYPDLWFYRSDAEKRCWYNAGTGKFTKNCPIELVSRISPGGSNSSVSCDYCANWYHRVKRKHIPTGGTLYDQPRTEQFCADSLRTLFRGREISLRQSTDSVITLQFSDNGINW